MYQLSSSKCTSVTALAHAALFCLSIKCNQLINVSPNYIIGLLLYSLFIFTASLRMPGLRNEWFIIRMAPLQISDSSTARGHSRGWHIARDLITLESVENSFWVRKKDHMLISFTLFQTIV
jgi:hypothetical protein